MEPQDPFRTFKKLYQVAKDDVHRIDGAWLKLEKTIPERIPKKAVEGFRKFAGLLERRPILAFLLFFALVCSRAVFWLLNAQFYIEDGREFYAPAFNLGRQTLMQDYASYYHLVPRILSLIAASFPVRYGPLVLTLLALMVQAASAAFLMSKRLERFFPSPVLRFWLGFVVIGYPYSNELFGNVAHSQWYLAILSVAIVCAAQQKRIVGWLTDLTTITVNCLTGPFAPVIALLGLTKWRGFKKWPDVTGMAILCALVTATTIHAPSRFGIHSGARAPLLERIIANQVVIGPIQGFHYVYQVPYMPIFDMREFLTALFGVVVILVGLRKAPGFIRAMAVLGLFSFSSCLVTQGNWAFLGDPGVGERYFFHIGLVLLFSIYSLSTNARHAVSRWFFRAIMGICALAILQNWVYDPPFHRFDYAPQIAKYDSLKPGEKLDITFPIDRKLRQNSWTMTLTKK
jgi:hypothetical protein